MDDLERDIHDAVAKIPGIAVLVAFGSRATGKARPDSDLDVAVLPAEEEGLARGTHRRHRLRIAVAAALAHLASDERVDVVLLDEAPDTLRQRVMEHGRMVLCRDPAAWRRLRVRTMKEYGDREWARSVYRRALRRRLLEGRPSGRSARARKPLERARRLSGEA